MIEKVVEKPIESMLTILKKLDDEDLKKKTLNRIIKFWESKFVTGSGIVQVMYESEKSLSFYPALERILLNILIKNIPKLNKESIVQAIEPNLTDLKVDSLAD